MNTSTDALPWRSPIDGSRFAESAPGDMLDYEPRPLTSGKHDRDPEPYLFDTGLLVVRGPAQPPTDGVKAIHRPRPQYDNHNPILDAFRRSEFTENVYAVRQWIGFTHCSGKCWDDSICKATPAQVQHANRVFTKQLHFLTALTT